MNIPKMKNYDSAEYSLIQVSPTIDSQELINIGVIIRDFKTNIPKVKLFDDLKKLTSRIHIENIDSLEYSLNILRKTIDRNIENILYTNFTNSLKINSPIPISLTETTIENQLNKLFKEKVTLLKTFPTDSQNSINNSAFDKKHIIQNLDSYIKSKKLEKKIKTRKYMETSLGVSKQIDTIGYNENNQPILVSDIISPATSHVDEMYMKSQFKLMNLKETSIKERIFYIPTMDNIDKKILEQIDHIKRHIRHENNFKINDSKDPHEFIESISKSIQSFIA
jgi:hypothetical protein|uniref:DUF3037 domain-containing protein n=1 Tax=Aliarcobacter sp. TaxID=2321116 RepID=UPI004047C81E